MQGSGSTENLYTFISGIVFLLKLHRNYFIESSVGLARAVAQSHLFLATVLWLDKNRYLRLFFWAERLRFTVSGGKSNFRIFPRRAEELFPL